MAYAPISHDVQHRNKRAPVLGVFVLGRPDLADTHFGAADHAITLERPEVLRQDLTSSETKRQTGKGGIVVSLIALQGWLRPDRADAPHCQCG